MVPIEWWWESFRHQENSTGLFIIFFWLLKGNKDQKGQKKAKKVQKLQRQLSFYCPVILLSQVRPKRISKDDESTVKAIKKKTKKRLKYTKKGKSVCCFPDGGERCTRSDGNTNQAIEDLIHIKLPYIKDKEFPYCHSYTYTYIYSYSTNTHLVFTPPHPHQR